MYEIAAVKIGKLQIKLFYLYLKYPEEMFPLCAHFNIGIIQFGANCNMLKVFQINK